LTRSKVITAPFLWTCASEVAGTVVNLARIPKGARLLTAEIVASAALGGTAQISIGIAGADNNGFYDDATAATLKTDGSAVTVG
ncbi:hypothetical protein, partial [Streptococcus pneumoniae]|uniref:hypothetical protein n=1 Tax=Streptococcus pneumoniae TaxID=1313 RepID=UPI001E63017B